MHLSTLLRSFHPVSESSCQRTGCQRKLEDDEEATIVGIFRYRASLVLHKQTVRSLKAGRQSSHLAHRSLMSHRCLFAPIFASRHTTSNVCADAQWQLDYGTPAARNATRTNAAVMIQFRGDAGSRLNSAPVVSSSIHSFQRSRILSVRCR